MLLGKRTRFDRVLQPKRRKQDVTDERGTQDDVLFSDIADVEAFPSDTLVSLQILRKQANYSPKIILKTHLYYLVHNRTSLDRELMELQYAGKIREFELPFASESYYIFMEDLEEAFREAKANYLAELSKPAKEKPKMKSVESSLQCGTFDGPPAIGYGIRDFPFTKDHSKPPSKSKKAEEAAIAAEIFDLFIPKFLKVFIGPTSHLQTMLQHIYPHNWKFKQFDTISPLVRGGALQFLAKNGRAESQGFQLACPGASTILAQIKAGRRQILSGLKRKRFKEEYAALIERKKLKDTTFPCTFHLKDLLGGDYVEKVNTDGQFLIRLPRNPYT